MAFLEYMLLALLGSASATPAGTLARTFTAEAITQPAGGAEGVVGQVGGGTPGKHAGTGRKGRSHARRTHRRGHKGGKVYEKATRNASKT